MVLMRAGRVGPAAASVGDGQSGSLDEPLDVSAQIVALQVDGDRHSGKNTENTFTARLCNKSITD